MKILVCTGDSHTWGQGAAGFDRGIILPFVAGEKRPAHWDSDGYVNILRRYVNAHTASSQTVIEASEIASRLGGEEMPCGVKLQGTVTFKNDGELARVFLCSDTPATAKLNGREYGFAGWLVAPVFGNGDLTIEGDCLLYRVEWYRGKWAVINAGVGSTPCAVYEENFMDSWVAAYHPDAVIAEAHTVNDWLTREMPDDYAENLTRYLRRLCDLTPCVAALTVPPVLGQTKLDGGFDYTEYVAASRTAIAAAGVPLGDVNARFAAVGEDHFSDIWHPNERGYALYAEEAIRFVNQWL